VSCMQDNVCPYLGDCSNAGWFEPPREECAQRWGRHNGCSATGSGSDWQEEQLTELSFKYSWPAACGSGSQGETVFYKIEDFGHVPAPNCNQIKYSAASHSSIFIHHTIMSPESFNLRGDYK
jgi:hypothetical protein